MSFYRPVAVYKQVSRIRRSGSWDDALEQDREAERENRGKRQVVACVVRDDERVEERDAGDEAGDASADVAREDVEHRADRPQRERSVEQVRGGLAREFDQERDGEKRERPRVRERREVLLARRIRQAD